MSYRTDRELVTLARSGDKRAFGALIDRYQSMVFAIAKKMVANSDSAKDLAQEAFLQAYLSLDRLQDVNRFSSWLYGIVLNVCRSYLRSQKTDFFSVEAIAGGLHFDAIPFKVASTDPAIVAEEQELYELVLKAVNDLSPKNRTTTLLFYQQQLTLHEISALLGISVTAVKGRLHRSRNQLREKLLPFYPQNYLISKRKQMTNNTIEVTIADVIPSVEKDTISSYVVVLWDKADRRLLPIWVGSDMGAEIARSLMEFPIPRPMTFQFMAKVLESVEAKLESVRVEALKESTYYAVVSLRRGDRLREVDARPSDAIALALQMKCPIYVKGELLEQCSMDIPEDSERVTFGKGLEQTRDLLNQKTIDLNQKLLSLGKANFYQELSLFLFGDH